MRGLTVLQARTAKDNYSNLAGLDDLFTSKLVKHGYSNLDLDVKKERMRRKNEIVDVFDD